MAIELTERGIPFGRQVPVSIVYKGGTIGTHRFDLLVTEKLKVELKAVGRLLPLHKAQVISCLTASGITLGLLIYFSVPVLKDGIRRVILT